MLCKTTGNGQPLPARAKSSVPVAAVIAGAPKITAARDLAEMLSLGYLAVVGAGRSTRYYPAIDGWV